MDLSIFKNARYYNKPDGEDYTGKMIATNGLMLMAAIPLATGDVLMFTKPKGYLGTIGVYGKWMGPALGMASFFTTTVYAATHLRGKDDVYNYILGGCAAASVFGKAARSPSIGIYCCGLFSLFGFFKKMSIQEGWKWLPTEEEWERNHRNGWAYTSKCDFTIMRDPGKNWSTSKNDA